MKTHSRTIFIGDIHGCYDELELLIHKLKIRSDDKVYLTGDLILKWPKSLKVLKYARKNNFLFVKGNKEYELLNAIKSWVYYNKEEEKLWEKLKHKYPELLNYLKDVPYYRDTNHFCLVHAGIIPEIDISEQSVDTLCYLRTLHWLPWYEHYTDEKKIIYGHWAIDWLKIRKNTIWLDSGCVYWGKLTAYILETWEIVQQKALKIYKNPHKKWSLAYHLKKLLFKIWK